MPATERRHHLLPAIAILAASAVLGASPAPVHVAQASAATQVAGGPAESWRTSLSTWLTAVERHRPGQRDADVATLAAWSWTDLNDALADFQALFELLNRAYASASRSNQQARIAFRSHDFSTDEVKRLLLLTESRYSPNTLFKRAAMLHTDVSLLMDERSRGPGAGAGSGVVVVLDGRPLGLDNSAQHLAFARKLLDLVSAAPAEDSMVRLWYRAIAAFLERETRLGDASIHLERAREIFPGDAQILLASGCLHETFASAKVQSSLGALQLPRGVIVGVGSRGTETELARSYFRQALKADETLTQARVRLARAVGLQGLHAEAARELRDAVGETNDTALQYYAWLLLGNEEQALGRPDAARDAYSKAAALYPRAQSPVLALSQLARTAGDRAGALEAVRQVLALPALPDARVDPWWSYHAGTGPLADELLAELRKTVEAMQRP